jgi:hypothetical protein
MSGEEVHKGDIGTVFELTVKDDGAVINISTVSVKQIKFKKPSGTVIIQTAEFKTDGSDGILTYTTLADDLNAAGSWRIQAYVEWAAGWKGHSDVVLFDVHPNVQ